MYGKLRCTAAVTFRLAALWTIWKTLSAIHFCQQIYSFFMPTALTNRLFVSTRDNTISKERTIFACYLWSQLSVVSSSLLSWLYDGPYVTLCPLNIPTIEQHACTARSQWLRDAAVCLVSYARWPSAWWYCYSTHAHNMAVNDTAGNCRNERKHRLLSFAAVKVLRPGGHEIHRVQFYAQHCARHNR